MSGGGGITLVINNIAALIQSINDLKMAKQEKAQMKACDGQIHNVELVVKDENGRDIGFEKQSNGTYKVIADSIGLDPSQLKKQQTTINKIKQRYGYTLVMQQLKSQGYQVVEEKKEAQNTVKIVARKWVS